MNVLRRAIPITGRAFAITLGPARVATDAISAIPNPCEVASGAHDCTAYVTWSTHGVAQARVRSGGAVLANVAVTAVNGPDAMVDGAASMISAAPNPCRIPLGKVNRTTYPYWFTVGTEGSLDRSRAPLSLYSLRFRNGEPRPCLGFGSGHRNHVRA